MTYKLEKQSSLDGAWELRSTHNSHDEAYSAGVLFKQVYANAARVVDPLGNVVASWKDDAAYDPKT